MNDIKAAVLRITGAALIILAGMVAAAMCGDVYGRAHAGDRP